FVEIGPDGVLSGMARQSVVSESAVFVPFLRRNRPEAVTAVTALGRLHLAGVPVDWSRLYEGSGARRIDLPTYAFQRERFWLNSETTGSDPSLLGLGYTDHPLLGATVFLADADADEIVMTGRLALGSHAWVADHGVLGSILLPGTAFVELAIRAGDQVGCDLLEELTLQAPLVLPEHGGRAVQVAVGAADAAGRRSVSVYSQEEDAEPNQWTRHAEGVLASGAVAPVEGLAEWPPPGATAIDVGGAYDLLLERGYGYGPVFQGLKTAWTSGEELYAEVALPESARADAERFGLHPALLDAAMHVALIDDGSQTDESTVLPFAWTNVALHAAGASVLRVRIAPAGQDSVSVLVADAAGEPVLSVGALVSRPVSVEQLGASGGSGALWEVAWRPLAGAGAGVVWSGWDDFVGGGVVSGPVVCEVGTGIDGAGGGVVSGVRSV
ncbi:polyketide synthase dehydratase domain-containing protein, partial [Streptomyces sp. JV185]|uniref:polyketide synthase dehydratase domain-containing protein n=1 Tax=Streptomyces sp. JV185 TaxID=858638 RepID=UPI002E7749E6